MSAKAFNSPEQYQLSSITIDGQDIFGIFYAMEIYEDIYKCAVTGNITITDSDGAKFIEENKIEFIEPFSFTAKGANGERIKFDGVLNGLRNEQVNGPIKQYVIDFSSDSVRENEKNFVVKSYKETNPEEIVKEMIKKIGKKIDTNARGQQMNYIGARRRPLDIVKYVLTHALTQETEATEKEDQIEEEAKGVTGFLCWETTDKKIGYKLEPVKTVLSGGAGENHQGYKTQLGNVGLTLEDSCKSIVAIEFKQIGDFQTKLRSGAFGSVNVSFDMDKGIYKEYKYYNKKNMTKKQQEAFPEGCVSRYFSKPLDNQKFNNTCQKAQPNTGDQSRKYLNQNAGQQNTFSDQTGQITLYPQFHFHAGDTIDINVSKVKDEKSKGGSDKKHSGRYVIQAIGHHFFRNGKAYTRIKTIRSTIQQNQNSSTKS